MINDNNSWSKQKQIFFFIILCGIAAIIYSQVLNAPFVYDDGSTIVENKEIKVNSIYYKFNTPRYVGLISFALNYRFNKLNPAGYHLINIIIHLANSILLFFLVKNILILLQNSLSEKNKYYLSFSVALIFLVHPLYTQAVTYITQRFTSLAALFVFLSLLFYLLFRKTEAKDIKEAEPSSTAGRLIFYILSLAAALFAYKTKENTATLPLMIILIELLINKHSHLSIKKRIFYIIPFFLLVAVIPLSFMSLDAVKGHNLPGLLKEIKETSYESHTISRAQYLLTEFRVIVNYIRLLFFPMNQAIDYYFPLSHSFFEPATFYSFCLIIILIIISMVLWQKSSFITFGLLWFFIFLLIESSFIPISDVIYEHRAYLPSVGLIAVVMYLIFMACDKFKFKVPGIIIVLIIAIALSAATYMRNEIWKSEIALWKDAVGKFPQNARAHCNLGAAYSFAGSCDVAVKELEIGLAAEPNNPKARSEIAYCYWKQGLPGIAIKEMLTAIQLDAKNISYYSNLALIYLEQGNSSDAISILKKAYAIDASNAQISALLGKAYCISGDFTNAIASFNKSLAHDHEDAYTYFDKGQCLLTFGNTDESRQNFFEALKKNPRLIDVYYYIGQSYEQEKDQEKAVYFYHQFLSRSSPENPLNTDAISKVPGSHNSQ